MSYTRIPARIATIQSNGTLELHNEYKGFPDLRAVGDFCVHLNDWATVVIYRYFIHTAGKSETNSKQLIKDLRACRHTDLSFLAFALEGPRRSPAGIGYDVQGKNELLVHCTTSQVTGLLRCDIHQF